MKKSGSSLIESWFTIFLGAVMLAVVGRSLAARINDFDLWWHLANGRFMLENRSVLRTDVFSHTLFGTLWVNFEWLSQIFLYLIFKTGNLTGIYAGKIGLSLAVLAVFALSLWRAGARGLTWLAGVWLGFLILRPRLNERLELVSLLFLPLLVNLLIWAKQETRVRNWIPWALFLLMILWANLHGGFVYGMGLVFLLNAGARWTNDDAGYVRFLNRTLLLMFLAALINPFGPRLALVFLEHARVKQDLSLIQEWAPPSFRDAPAFWLLFFFSTAALIWGWIHRRKEAKFWGLAVAIFLAWGGIFYRNSALAALVVLPFLAELFSRLNFSGLFKTAARSAVGAFLVVSLGTAARKSFSSPLPDGTVSWYRLPVGASRFIESHDLQGTMFNSYELGGYLAWALGPQRKIFMDGRYIFHPMLGDQAHLFTEKNTDPSTAWTRYLDRFGVTYAVTSYEPSFSVSGPAPFPSSFFNFAFPRDHWALVYWDDAGLVFVKRLPEYETLIRENEYRFLWPYNLEQMQYLLHEKQISPVDVKRELALHRERTGNTVIGSSIEKLLDYVK